MVSMTDEIEARRMAVQAELDDYKSQSERNRLGQFATPISLAVDILQFATRLMALHEKVRLLDPAIGTGSFYSALRQVFPPDRIAEAVGFEIDSHYGDPASQLWASSGLLMKQSDFTRESPSARFNLIICNPPYVRHHHLVNDEKKRLHILAQSASGMKLSGLTGLYCYFLAISHAWMADGGIAGWLIPSEFMDVNYGRAVKRYLLEDVTLLHIHRFDPSDVQFADALVSSAVVWFRKSRPPINHAIEFSFGGSLSAPTISRQVSSEVLAAERKWSRFPEFEIRGAANGPKLSELFHVKRGIATGHNGYFILNDEEIASLNLPMELFRPILPSPRYMRDDEILSDDQGMPLIDRRLFLLDTKLSEDVVRDRYPSLFAYLQNGRDRKIHDRYLCRHRDPWYAQEERPPAPIVCTYLGRSDAKSGKPFRFILNESRATVANVYLAMYPTPVLAAAMRQDQSLIRRVWSDLNDIPPAKLLGEGRVYGGGLHKLEPRELANVDATAIAEMIPGYESPSNIKQLSLFAAAEA